MLYKHIKSGDLYRRIFDVFDNDDQKPAIVYMSVANGSMFTTHKDRWNDKFEYVGNPQDNLKPRCPNTRELDV